MFLSHAWLDQSHQRMAENPRRGPAPMLRDCLIKLGIKVFFDDDDPWVFLFTTSWWLGPLTT